MSQPPAGGYPPPDPSQPGSYPPPAQPGPPPGGFTPPGGGSSPVDPAAYQPPPGYAAPPPGYAAPPPGYSAPPPGYQQPAAGGYAPPAGGYPPPAPGYQPSGTPAFPPSGGSAKPSFDMSKVGRSDWIIVGSGLVLLIFSFFGWLSVSYDFGDGISESASYGSWHKYCWLATLLGVAVAVVVALRTMMGQQLPQVKPQFLMFAAAAGFVITLISLIDIFSETSGLDSVGGSVGPGFGIWVCLVVSAAQTYFVWLWAQREPGWTLPKLPGPAL